MPGGGLAPDSSRWISSRRSFFLAVRVLSAVFRGKLLSALENAVAAKKIDAHLASGVETKCLLRKAARTKWVVYAKRPFAGPEQVLAYLGRYTHKIAISNERVLALEGDQVSFSYKDRADGDRRKQMTLPADAFLRRFLLHVLPAGFVRIRHYGLLANSIRTQRLALCRELLGVREDPSPPALREPWEAMLLRLTGRDVSHCPRCAAGHLRITREIQPTPRSARPAPAHVDTS